jgi:endonuclease/exonuclease/phosphatase family metal-dependent hydrolase
MKIATWNIERLKHKKELSRIVAICEQVNADILVLTETDEQVQPRYDYCFQTEKPTGNEAIYKETENRVSVFTNFRCVRQYSTYDSETAVCVELETPMGNLLVYGTIMGISGNRRPSYMKDLKRQMENFSELLKLEKPICICGDFNCSFADNYYFTNTGRSELKKFFVENRITLPTGSRAECIDHIAISEAFADGVKIEVDEWNQDKTLSDHKGISVMFKKAASFDDLKDSNRACM